MSGTTVEGDAGGVPVVAEIVVISSAVDGQAGDSGGIVFHQVIAGVTAGGDRAQ